MNTHSYTYRLDGLSWIWPDGRRSWDPPPQVAEQIRAYGRHYNARIEIARRSRTEYREARSKIVPQFNEAEAAYATACKAVDAFRKEIKALNKDARRRAAGTEMRAKLTVAVQIKKAVGQVLKAAREAATESSELQVAAAVINGCRNGREKEARAATPAYWGTYLMAEDASAASARGKSDPEFRRWMAGLPTTVEVPCPEGKIGVQVQSTKPLTVAGLFECNDSRIRLEPPKPRGRHGFAFSRGWIRIGSEGRAPIWAEFEVRVRRAMPLDGRITWAWINRRRYGLQWRHALCIGVEQTAPEPSAHLDRVLAVDLNMRIVETGIRIGYTFDGSDCRQLTLPQAIVDKMEHARSIQAIRDREFDSMRDELVAWMKEHDSPSWLRERTENLALWRSSARLASVVIGWRGQRFAGDELIFRRADAWRAQDRHLCEYRHGDHAGACNRRLNLYRHWAKEITERYGTVIVAAWDWSEIARRPKPEEESDIPDAVRTMRFNVAVSELVTSLEHAARSRGGRVIHAELEPVGCLRCGKTTLSEDPKSGWTDCLACGHRMVRDEMQARGLYAARERFGGDDGSGAAREPDLREPPEDSPANPA